MERLYEIHAAGRYDLVIVDTPPSRNALDFLDAPARMADFFGSRLLRWLTMPYRSRVLNMASRPFYQVADRILGTKFLEDIAEFFSLLRTMERGFVERARAVTKVLGDRRTTFVVVTTLEAAPAREAEFFIDALGERGLHLGALVLNKVLPQSFTDRAAGQAADYLRRERAALSREVAPMVGASPEQVGRVLAEVAVSFHNFEVVAKREAEQRAELAVAPEVTVAVPYLDADIHDLPGLVALGERLW
jgi:anion-transporting  ArsA/GET3 family ATPase